MIAVLRLADRLVAALCRWGVVGGLLGLFVLLLLAVVVRFLPLLPISGYDELVELLVIWLTMLGAVALWRCGAKGHCTGSPWWRRHCRRACGGPW
jgi:TRAP-type C4-dicarboxylate transport system permease small subunit